MLKKNKLNNNKYLEFKEEALNELKPYVPKFLTKRKFELILIKNHLKIFDFESIKKITHQWKGYAAPYGFEKLAYFAKLIEENCTIKKTKEILLILEKIDLYLQSK